MTTSLEIYKMERKQTFAVCVLISITLYLCLVISMNNSQPTHITINFVKNEYRYSALPYGNINDVYKDNISSIPFCDDPELYYFSPAVSDTDGDALSRPRELTVFRTQGGYCKMTTPQRQTVFRDLCFSMDRYFESSTSPVRAFFTSYDSRIAGNKYLFSVQNAGVVTTERHDEAVNYWQVTGQKASKKREKDFMYWPAVLVFTPFLDRNYSLEQIHHVMLPQLHQNVKRAKDIKKSLVKYANYYKVPGLAELVVPNVSGNNSPLSQTSTFIGFDKLLPFEQLTSKGPFCFKWAIFGAEPIKDIALKRKSLEDVTKTLLHNWPTPMKCKENHVLFVTRTETIRITDLTSVVKHFKSKGYKNTKVVHMEDLSFKQQFELIRCTSVLVGFQGDALALYTHLPTNASVVEFVHTTYPSDWGQRIKDTRPDLYKYTIECEFDIPDNVWHQYANAWFNHTGPMDTKWKLKVVQKSKEQWPLGDGVFTESNSLCAVASLFDKLPKFSDVRKKESKTEVIVPHKKGNETEVSVSLHKTKPTKTISKKIVPKKT